MITLVVCDLRTHPWVGYVFKETDIYNHQLNEDNGEETDEKIELCNTILYDAHDKLHSIFISSQCRDHDSFQPNG